jgi:hypothetical protein
MKNEEILDPSEWPVTTEAVVADIIASLSPENKNLVRNTPREALVKFHFS